MKNRLMLLAPLFTLLATLIFCLSTPVAAEVMPRIAAGSVYTVALKSDGTVWAWGYNSNGQLGSGTTASYASYSATPVQVIGPSGTGILSGVTAIAASRDFFSPHTIALRGDGTVWTWGGNYYGQLGYGTSGYSANSTLPAQVPGLSGIIAIAAGDGTSAVVKNDGTVWVWGDNTWDQLGNVPYTSSKAPVQITALSGITSIAAGSSYFFASKSDGTVWAWGRNDSGQFGNGTSAFTTPDPVQVNLMGIEAIAAGGNYGHAAAVKNNGTVWTWGANYYGQLGNNTTNSSPSPAQVPGLSGFISIIVGYDDTIALKNDSTVWAWGENEYGQLGYVSSITCLGLRDCSITPMQVPGLIGVMAIAGQTHSVALKSDGTVWAWGSNSNGELGNGTTAESTTPVQVIGPSGVGFLNLGSGSASLTVTTTGAGKVTSSPAGIDCGAICSKYFTIGASINLTATPDPGSTFTGWSGVVCSGTSTTCQVTMDDEKTVTANFAGPTKVGLPWLLLLLGN